MNPLEWFSGEAWARLVHALLHSLWLGAAITGALAAALRAIPARRTDLRYGLSVCAMAVLVLGVLGAWALPGVVRGPALQVRNAVVNGTPPSTPTFRDGPQVAEQTSQPFRLKAGLRTVAGLRTAIKPEWTAYIAGLWVAGVALMLARTAGALAGAGRLRRGVKELDAELTAIAETLRISLGIAQRVGFAMCDRLVVPAAMGIFRPMVLLPASLMTSIPPEQLRAILAHELAHIRRHDYLVNIAQMIFESLLFFNPAAWWISRQIRHEREACCDALATAALGGGVDYAQALADCAVFMRDAAAPAATALTGGRRGGLLDRILRLTRPDYRPRLRLPWHGLVLVLVVSAIALACLQKGTEKAVEVIAQKFLPAEKVEQMEKVKADSGPANYEEWQSRKKQVRLIAAVRTADGGAVPKHFWIYVKTPFSGLATSANSYTSGTRTFFGVNFEAGSGGEADISINDQDKQYAPARLVLGPEQLLPKPQLVEFVLERGFGGQIEVVGPEGKPVADADVSGRYPENSGAIQGRTDAMGIARFDHLTTWPLSITITAAGYESLRGDAPGFKPTEKKQIKLTRAVPLKGIVLDARTGKPIAWAQVKFLYLEGPQWGDYSDGKILATTDEKGEFTINTLRADSKYWLLIDAPDHEVKILERVSVANDKIEIRLGPARFLRGKIVGPVEMLGKEPKLTYDKSYKTGSYSTHTNSVNVPVEIRNGEGSFLVQNLWPGKVDLELEINVGREKSTLHKSVEMRGPEENYTIDLKEIVNRPQRRVVFRFDIPPGAPVPRGLLTVNYTDWRDGKMSYSRQRKLDLDKGEKSLMVPVPTQLSLEPDGLVGYWFERSKTMMMKVPEGKDDFEIRVPVEAAGMIHGTIEKPKNNGDHISAYVEAVDLPKGYTGFPPNYGFDVLEPGRFASPPLMLDVTYVARFSRGNTYVFSDPIRLTAKSPMAELKIKMPEGEAIRGEVVDEAGQRVAGVKLSMQLKRGWPKSNSFWFGGTRSDQNGKFSCDVNAEAGKYFVRVDPGQEWQPVVVAAQPGGVPVRIELVKGYSVSGVVRNRRTGKAVPNCGVSARVSGASDYSRIEDWAETQADSEGRFTLRGLRPEVYVIPGPTPNLKFDAATQTAPLDVWIDSAQ